MHAIMAAVKTEAQAQKLISIMTRWFGGEWFYDTGIDGGDYTITVMGLESAKEPKARYFLIGFLRAAQLVKDGEY